MLGTRAPAQSAGSSSLESCFAQKTKMLLVRERTEWE